MLQVFDSGGNRLLTPFQFANIAREALDCDRIELIPHFLQPDPLDLSKFYIAISISFDNECGRLLVFLWKTIFIINSYN